MSKEVVDASNKRMSPDIRVLKSYVKPSEMVTLTPKPKKQHRLSISSQSKVADDDKQTVSLPVPVNGDEYSKLKSSNHILESQRRELL